MSQGVCRARTESGGDGSYFGSEELCRSPSPGDSSWEGAGTWTRPPDLRKVKDLCSVREHVCQGGWDL